jgi:putative transposase
MRLVERHIIKKSDNRYSELDKICFLSKNLYNAGLYATRQFYFTDKKFLNYINLNNQFVKEKQVDYYSLPAKVAQQTLKLVEQNFKSFFGSLKAKRNGNNDRKVKIPHYLDKQGRYSTIYTIQAISKIKLQQGIIKLSGTNIEIETNKSNIQQVRLSHKGNHIVVEIIYNIQEKELLQDNNRYCSIDLGLNNLATLGSNILKPIIINGKPLKSINQYYNKRLAQLKSKLINGQKSSKRIKSLTERRNNKINDYLHKSSRYIVNYLVSNNVNTLVIGQNKEWKQEINIGKVNNQKFVQIPHSKLIELVTYKNTLEGIKTITNEESYTSKCSFMDNEPIKKHETYVGKRIKRGLFRTELHKLVNADWNGAMNILKKVVGEFQYPIEVCSTPVVITMKLN